MTHNLNAYVGAPFRLDIRDEHGNQVDTTGWVCEQNPLEPMEFCVRTRDGWGMTVRADIFHRHENVEADLSRQFSLAYQRRPRRHIIVSTIGGHIFLNIVDENNQPMDLRHAEIEILTDRGVLQGFITDAQNGVIEVDWPVSLNRDYEVQVRVRVGETEFLTPIEHVRVPQSWEATQPGPQIRFPPNPDGPTMGDLYRWLREMDDEELEACQTDAHTTGLPSLSPQSLSQLVSHLLDTRERLELVQDVSSDLLSHLTSTSPPTPEPSGISLNTLEDSLAEFFERTGPFMPEPSRIVVSPRTFRELAQSDEFSMPSQQPDLPYPSWRGYQVTISSHLADGQVILGDHGGLTWAGLDWASQPPMPSTISPTLS